MYGMLEANTLLNKMHMASQVVPTTGPDDSLRMLHYIWRDIEIHKGAANGFKECGLSVDLGGKEDFRIVKEAAHLWWSTTSDGFTNMRANINDELSFLELEHSLSLIHI